MRRRTGHIFFLCPPAVRGSLTLVTTKPTPDTVHSPTPGQLHVESIQLACTCALCCCYALCMKREELLIFYSFWLRCFVVMMQYVGFLGRSQLFGSQVKVGAPTWQLARANSGSDPPRCGRAWPGTAHPVCTRRLPVAHADRRAGECNGADEQCSGDALRASGRGGCSRVPSVPPVWVRPVQVPAPGSCACPPRGGHAGGAGGCGGEAGRAG